MPCTVRLQLLAGCAVIASLSCGGASDPGGNGPGGNPEPPAWVGTYTYFAGTANYCTEGPLYECSCGPSGHYEGTLTLSGTATSVTGSLEVQECRPGEPCSQPVTMPVVEFKSYAGSNTYGFGFCAGLCPVGGNNGGWGHNVLKIQPAQDSLIGEFRHADGSPRGCGSESGSFKATRR